MKEEDILLIAGKGHETYQIFSFGVEDFDDLLVAQQYCK
jgi:UDP-N-acetylmuramoyl-L-alanyl-D-glutamate--2,6-diaminopimelate ligase